MLTATISRAARRAAALTALALAALGCGGVITGPGEGGGRAARALRLDAAALAVDEGADARLTATVLDARQEPIPVGSLPPSTQIEWTSGDAAVVSVSPGGVLVAHRPGTATVSATLASAIGRPSVSATVEVRARVAGLAVASGDAQTRAAGAALAEPVTVRVTGVSGAPVAGVPVTFAVAEGGGSVPAEPVVTDADGLARAAWTLGTRAGPNVLVATTVRLPDVVARATATGVAGSPARLRVVSGSGQVAPSGEALADPLVVEVSDAHGNPAAGVPVAWAPNAGQGTVEVPAAVTDAEGRARARWTLGEANGPMVAAATVEGLPPALFEATARTGGAARVRVTPEGVRFGTLGRVVQLTADVLDRFGNVLPDAVVEWQVDGAAAAVDAAGRVTARANGTARVVARVAETGASGSAEVTVAQVPATIRLTMANPPLVPGAQRAVQAQVLDSAGAAVVPAPALAWRSQDPAVATVSAEGVVTAVAPGQVTITAAAGDASGSVTVTVAPRAGRRLVVVDGNGLLGPADHYVGMVVVRLEDGAGQPIAGQAIRWEQETGGDVDQESAETNAQGLARARWAFGPETGHQAMRVTAPDLPDVAPARVEGTAGVAPDEMTVVSGDGQTVVEGYTAPAPIVFRVTAGGRPVQNLPYVQFSRGTGGTGTVEVLDDRTDADGRIAVRFAPVGNKFVIAQLYSRRFRILSATANMNLLAAFETTGGDDQVGDAGQPLPQVLRARVLAGTGQPQVGVVVRWNVESGGGRVMPLAEGRTDAAGYASAQWTLGSRIGEQEVEAAVSTARGEKRVYFQARAVLGGEITCDSRTGVEHSTDLTASATWTRAASPHHLRGAVTVRNGATLTIEPGALVCVGHRDNQRSSLTFAGGGRLDAVGTAAERIRIVSDPRFDGTMLDHITFADAPARGSVLRHVVLGQTFEGVYATDGHALDVADAEIQSPVFVGLSLLARGSRVVRTLIDGGVHPEAFALELGRDAVADGVRIVNVFGDGIIVQDRDVVIRNSEVVGAGGTGIRIAAESGPSGTVLVQDSHIADNGGGGVRVGFGAPAVTLLRNRITGNNEYGVRNSDERTIEAAHNWWGSAGGPGAPENNGAGGNVRFDPWLLAPPEPPTVVARLTRRRW